MSTVFAAIGLAATLLVPPAAPVAEAPDATAAQPSAPTIEVVTINGSGCPAGSVEAPRITSSGDRVQISFEPSGDNTFSASTGPRAEATDFRKNCQIGIQVDVPRGYTYAVERVRMRGTASLRSGATGVIGLNTYFQGMSATATATEELDGPLRSSWRTWLVPDDVEYAPCGEERNLNLNADVRVMAGTSSSSANSSVTADLDFTVDFDLRRC